MGYQIEALPNFERELKRLSRKYPSLKRDLATLVTDLADNPATGTALGHNCYKIRLAITSKR